MRRRAEAAEKEVKELKDECTARLKGILLRDRRIDELEALCWSNGIDPKPAFSPPPPSPENEDEVSPQV